MIQRLPKSSLAQLHLHRLRQRHQRRQQRALLLGLNFQQARSWEYQLLLLFPF